MFCYVLLSIILQLLLSVRGNSEVVPTSAAKDVSSARQPQVNVENIIIAISQSFAYLISNLKKEKTGNVETVGFTSYITCTAVVLLLVLKCFTVIRSYCKNGAIGEYQISES